MMLNQITHVGASNGLTNHDRLVLFSMICSLDLAKSVSSVCAELDKDENLIFFSLEFNREGLCSIAVPNSSEISNSFLTQVSGGRNVVYSTSILLCLATITTGLVLSDPNCKFN